ncbi:hypothetical protein GCM10023261_02520 [Bartonella jaculi]|uniref:Uncharacterized protein n=2 Tax=Bartonella jaculi TaxID=686226 RepID=A0ABP9MY01_9HYPH
MTSDIDNYPVTEDLLLKMEKIGKEFDENSIKVSGEFSIAVTHDTSSEIYASYLSNQPKIMAILKNNNITPKDFATGCRALEGLLMTLSQIIEGSEENEIALGKKDIISKNIEFGKKHMYRIISISGKICG